MINFFLHKNLCQEHNKISDWYCEKTKSVGYPIYSSYEIRDSGFKISNVDGNIYPAGFNNICHNDRDSSIEIMKKYIDDHYGKATQKILLITEEHTQNPFYWDNIVAIQNLLEKGGRKVLIAFPRQLEKPLHMQSAQGHELIVHSGFGNSAAVSEFKPDLIISNNDFAVSHDEWAKTLSTPVNPPRELGWYQRKKSRYFYHYNNMVKEFSDIVGLDPFTLNVKTEIFENFEVENETSMDHLADRIDEMLEQLKGEYQNRQIKEEPFVFVKNNAGTYGLAVMRVGKGEEIKELSYKARKKMKAAKGGREVEEVIIQEGISSRVQTDGMTAEPVIYMIGCELAGGFLRSHAEKSSTESLNSPGAVYKRLCVSDLNVSLEGHPLENVYGWSARLGLLAIALEAAEMKVEFKDFHKKPCR
jgi:glutamate--cysteine ligase